MEYFSLSQQLGEQTNIGQESSNKIPEFSHQITLNNTTPPQKRRRGRPPKCPTSSDDQPSPAAHLSAAVVKQGTPKASAPLMRISPLRGAKRRDSNSSPLQRSKENPSPKGGLLMKLDDEADRSPTKKQKRASNATSSSTASNSIHSLTLSSTTPKSRKADSKDVFKTPNKITMNTQENIHLLTNEAGIEKALNESVNPSLLLSSPMPNLKKSTGINYQQNKLKSSAKKEKQRSSTILSSSPMTPNSYASSCFSSIIQSSPLYHGYYANQSSPNPLSSSPIKFQMKPIDLPDIKGLFKEAPKSRLPKIEKVPKNPVNSPILKPQATSNSSTKIQSSSRGEYKLSFSIDERGQAQVVKVKTEAPKAPKPTTQNSTPSRPKFTRHESLMSINQGSFNLPRTGSLSNIHEAKEPQLSISSVLSPTTSSHDYEMFIEPSQMTSDPLVGDFGQSFDPTKTSSFMNATDGDQQDEFEDESVTHDARNALIKMIRRSV